MRKVLVSFSLVTVLLIVLSYSVRLVVVRTEKSNHLAVLLRRQTGEIHFKNSVTGGTVEIGFSVLDRFRNFSMRTDSSRISWTAMVAAVANATRKSSCGCRK